MSEYIHVSVAWPYANGDLHLGHVAGVYLPADVFARYHRLKGNRVLMVSGSDTHGTPISIAAQSEGRSPRQIVDRYHRRILESQRDLGISYDLFTHTETENHHRVAQRLFRQLLKNGFLARRKEKQLYSETRDRFLPDRLVEGTCPYCGDPGARGDQCDSCGHLIDPLELISPRSKLDGSTPVVRESEHFYFDLPALADRLRLFLDGAAGRLRPNVLRFSRGYLADLRSRAITRDLDWGVRIPLEGWESKRLYVWFEAVIGYLSASLEWARRSGEPDAWKSWWHDPEAKIYNFLGKDNIPFHSVIWPAILLASGAFGGRRLNLPYDVAANEYLTFEGDPFSTSRGHAVWLPEVLSSYQTDAVRYSVASTFPESGDADFSWEELHRRVNNELLAAWGNLCQRVLGFTRKRFHGIVPAPGGLTGADEAILGRSIEAFDRVGALVEQVKLRAALREAMGVVHEANAYITAREPWKRIATDPEDAATSVHTVLRVIDNLKTVLAPFLPFSSQLVHEQLGGSGRLFGELRIETDREEGREHDVLVYDGTAAVGRWQPGELAAGQALGPPGALFRKVG